MSFNFDIENTSHNYFMEMEGGWDSRTLKELYEQIDSDLSALKEDINGEDRLPNSEEQESINLMVKLISEIEAIENDVSSSEWECGIYFIPSNEFTDYIKQDIKDCGYISKDLPSWIVINWEETADNLKVDYATIAINGIEYFYRNC